MSLGRDRSLDQDSIPTESLRSKKSRTIEDGAYNGHSSEERVTRDTNEHHVHQDNNLQLAYPQGIPARSTGEDIKYQRMKCSGDPVKMPVEAYARSVVVVSLPSIETLQNVGTSLPSS